MDHPEQPVVIVHPLEQLATIAEDSDYAALFPLQAEFTAELGGHARFTLEQLQTYARVQAELYRAYDLEEGPRKDELITVLSLVLIAFLTQFDPRDPTPVRYIHLDWDTDGLVPMRLYDANHELVDNEDLCSFLTIWVSNIRDPALAGLIGHENENGPFLLDTMWVVRGWAQLIPLSGER
ncbi:hypothetical protein [Nocardia nova]|uniref:hypothetical protein n=1 Tax=Nocardia nova TaxID=37330 RepID=UPI0033F51904